MEDESDLSTEEILEAFRAKRKKKADGPASSDGSDPEEGPDRPAASDGGSDDEEGDPSASEPDEDAPAETKGRPTPTADPDDEPASKPRPGAQETSHATADEATEEADGPPTKTTGASKPAKGAETPTRSEPPARVIDGEATERPLHPALADEVQAVQGQLHERGWRKGQYMGAAFLFAGLLLLLFERYLAWYGDGPARMGPVPVWPFLLGVAAAGGAALATFIYYPGTRRVEFEKDLGKTLRSVTDSLVLARWMQWGGLAAAGIGFLVPILVGFFTTPPAPLAAIFLTLGVAGATAWLVGALRSPDLRRLGVQSAAYAHWQAKEGGLDPVRIARVLGALDELLGQLPDSAVHRFLETREADEYMALLEETVGGPGSSED